MCLFKRYDAEYSMAGVSGVLRYILKEGIMLFHKKRRMRL